MRLLIELDCVCRFSFRRDATGIVFEVQYPDGCSTREVMWKKAVAGLFSMSLEVIQI